MRCLYCDKKLSLLKLAKGDSFCSAEHFDAYQLQISKSAFERLVNLPGEEVPRIPLIIKGREESAPGTSRTAPPPAPPKPPVSRAEPARTPPPQAPAPPPSVEVPNAAFDRLMAVPPADAPKAPLAAKPRPEKLQKAELQKTEPQKAEKPPKAPAQIEAPRGRKGAPEARLAAPPEAPPPAPFAKPDRPASCAPKPPDLIASGPDESRQEPALPVHAIESTGGLLNLHHGIARSEMGPFNWKSIRQQLLEHEEAARKPLLPPLSLLPIPQAPDPEAMESLADHEPFAPLEAAAPQASDRVLSLEEAPARRPVFPASSAPSISPAEPAPVDPRIPFLMAPSFRERQIVGGRLDSTASLTANELPVAITIGALHRWPLIGGKIASASSLLKVPPPAPRDAARDAVAAALELPGDPRCRLLRVNEHASPCKSAVRSLISRERTPKDSGMSAKRPLDAVPPPPASVLTRPAPRIMPGLGSNPLRSKHSPAIRTMEPAIGPTPRNAALLCQEQHLAPSRIALAPGAPPQLLLIPGALIADAVLAEPVAYHVLFDPPSVAMEFGLHVTIASLTPRQPLAQMKDSKLSRFLSAKPAGHATPAGQSLDPLPVDAYFSKKLSLNFTSLPFKAPALVCRSARKLSWRRFDSPRPTFTRPKPMVVQPAARFFPPPRPGKAPEMIASPLRRVAAVQPFVAPPDSLSEETFLKSYHSAILPSRVDSPCGPLGMAKGLPHSSWEPVLPPVERQPQVKFLPIRSGPIPPAARSWPRLGPPTR